MHTPGCQGALVAIAPAYSGAITGLTFFFVAITGILNPMMTKWIVQVDYLHRQFDSLDWLSTRMEPRLLHFISHRFLARNNFLDLGLGRGPEMGQKPSSLCRTRG